MAKTPSRKSTSSDSNKPSSGKSGSDKSGSLKSVKSRSNSSQKSSSNAAQRAPRGFKKISATLQRSWLGYLSLTALLLIALAVYWSLLREFPVQKPKQLLTIESGDNYSHLIQRWNDQDLIHLPILLKLYQKFWIRDSLKAGVYEIDQGMSVAAVLALISNADNAQMNRLLVIEGTTFKQLKQQLLRDPYVKKTVLQLPDAQLLRALNSDYNHPEGLFAPDTYFFAKGETDLSILKKLYARQQQILQTAWQQRDPNVPYRNAYEALIMASIVEKETSLDRELNQVSGVFVRRLQQGMRLQTDPTVIYGMGDAYNGNIRKQDLLKPTPYNTYTQAGLPPTPIALPSAKAIAAALHPDQSQNLYFVATGNGGHIFSRSYAAHQQAVARYLAALRASGS